MLKLMSSFQKDKIITWRELVVHLNIDEYGWALESWDSWNCFETLADKISCNKNIVYFKVDQLQKEISELGDNNN
jgi:hypothetical protein